jgi:hypothetical protein
LFRLRCEGDPNGSRGAPQITTSILMATGLPIGTTASPYRIQHLTGDLRSRERQFFLPSAQCLHTHSQASQDTLNVISPHPRNNTPNTKKEFHFSGLRVSHLALRIAPEGSMSVMGDVTPTITSASGVLWCPFQSQNENSGLSFNSKAVGGLIHLAARRQP